MHVRIQEDQSDWHAPAADSQRSSTQQMFNLGLKGGFELNQGLSWFFVLALQFSNLRLGSFVSSLGFFCVSCGGLHRATRSGCLPISSQLQGRRLVWESRRSSQTSRRRMTGRISETSKSKSPPTLVPHFMRAKTFRV